MIQCIIIIDNNIIGQIGKGLLIFLGVEAEDTDDLLQKYVDKIVLLKIDV